MKWYIGGYNISEKIQCEKVLSDIRNTFNIEGVLYSNSIEDELIWIKDGIKIYFGTDMFLLRDRFNEADLNNQYFLDYYNGFGQVTSDNTPYKNVKRVPSGSYIEIDIKLNNVINNKYWDLSIYDNDIKYENEEQYIEAFRDIISKSISNRVLEDGANGILMSGGIDSTAIFALSRTIKNLDLKIMTAVFDEIKECDERYYTKKIESMYKKSIKYVVADELGILSDYPNGYFYTYEPYVNSLSYKLTGELIKVSGEEGVKNLIDGYAADHVLSGSPIVALDMLRKFEVIKAIKYLSEISKSENNSWYTSFNKYIIKMICNKNYFVDFDSKLYLSKLKSVNRIKEFNKKQLYMQLCNVSGTRYSDREICPRCNVVSKHPFLDKDLIEYIYSIPGELRRSEKESKYILRKTVEELVPSEILFRSAKTQHVALTFKSISKIWPNLYSILSSFRVGKLECIEMTKKEWTDELSKFRNGQHVREDFFLLMSLEVWLYEYSNHIELSLTL